MSQNAPVQRAALPPEDPFFADALGGDDEGIDVAQYLRMLRRHWRLVAILVALAALASIVQYSVTPKSYRARAVIEIRRPNSLMGFKSAPIIDYRDSQTFYPTQHRLLKSRGLAERVVQHLRLQEDPTFNPGWKQSDEGGSDEADDRELAALASRLSGGLSVNPIKQTNLVELSYVSSSGEFAARAVNGYAEVFVEWSRESRVEKSAQATTFIEEQIEAIKLEIEDKEREVQSYSRAAGFTDLEGTSNVTTKRLEALNSDYIGAVSERIKREAEVAELSSGGGGSGSSTDVQRLRSAVESLESEYAGKLETYKPEWPAMQELQTRIEQAKSDLQKAFGRAGREEIEKARSAYQLALRREQSLSTELDETGKELREQKVVSVGFNILQIEIQTRRTLLNSLLKTLSETGVAARVEGSGESNVRLVDSALVPRTPFRPSLRRDLMAGLGLGLIVGIGAALLIEYLDRTIKTSEQLERYLGLPILGVIPDVSDEMRGYGYFSRYGYGYGYGYGNQGGYGYGARKGKGRSGKGKGKGKGRSEPRDAVKIELLPQTRPKLAVAEAYRSFRTALLLSSAESLRVIALSSAEAGEGKTATISNLAIVLAQLGRRVLLVDADLRKPRQHRVFKASNQIGLVNYLTGGVGLDEIVTRVEVPNLFLVAAGPHPPNPSELLASDRMAKLIEEAKESFDFVLIDTPPVLAVTDPIIVGSIADGIVICTQAGRVVREDLRACRDRLLLSEVKILGVVLNRFRSFNRGYSKRYHYYSAYADTSEDSMRDSAA